MFVLPYTHLQLTPLWNEARQYVTKTACIDFSCQNNWLSAGWDNVQHANSNGFAWGSITKFWFECDQNILIQNVILTKTVKDIGNRFSLQQDSYSVIYDIMTWGESNIGKKIFLTKTVKEIKSKPICCLACKFEDFSADTVLFENTATKDKRLIYHVQSWLQCLQACTNLVSRKNIDQVRTVELLFDNIFIAW